ncbi:putative ribonuclease H-like domain-containing protein [Tanacetum coccineum]|uniref:Ribonuclease H-like domain-containing protein n=1 Tax=Tanacetum coccineum TaxID=301880 RepID=A0ABQ5B568_9ASTR
MDLQDRGVIDSGCSRHMIGNMSYLTDYEEIDRGYVAFGGNPKGGKITRKNSIKTGNLDFENVYFVRELKFNLFSVSQMCDKKNSVLFNDTECIVLSPNFKLIAESQVLLKVPRKNNMYSVNLKNIVPKGDLTCLFAKATSDESKLWHRRLCHLNFKTINKLVKGNLVRGLPSKLFENDQTCVASQKGKQHRASSRTPQQNEVAKRRNRTLIEAARTMLANSKLPTTFWAEAVNTACYVQNKVPFGCPVTILNTIDHLGNFDGKDDEGFFVEYFLNNKAFRVFNSRTRIVEENLHIRFSENIPNVVGSGPDWLFDIDALTITMNYEPIVAGTQSNGFAGTKASDNAGQARKETEPIKYYILLPLWTADPLYSQDLRSSHDDGSKPLSDDGNNVDEDPRKDSEFNVVGRKTSIKLPFDPNMPALEYYSIFDLSRDDDDDGAEADMNNLDITIQVSPNLTTRIHKDHHLDQVIEDLQSATQTRNMSNNLKEHGFVSTVQQRTNHKDLQNCLFACFLSQEELKKVIHALKDPSWTEAMQEELLQFKNKSGIVIRNKARLVAQGYTQKEEIEYDEVFSPVARIEVIRLFLAYASFKDFVVYQMDVKSAFLYRKIKEEVYACQPPGFEDSDFPDRVYKDNGFQRGKIDKILFIKRNKGDILLVQVYVDDIIFGSTKKELCNAFEKLMHEKFQMRSMRELTFFLGLQVQQKKDGIFISQDKYVVEILKKFEFTEVKTASKPMETQKPLIKDEDGKEVDVHMYRSMIGSLMYLTSSRPDIMFAVCACARYQVNPKVSHLHAMKRISRYLKGQPKLGLWYPKDSLFDLVTYTDSDYAGASLDRKSTTRGCQFLRCRLISWQCKKQIVVANSTTEVECVAASSCCGQAKTINGKVQLHALVNGKKIIVTESTVRRDLKLEDAEDLFPTMLVQNQMGECSAMPTDPHHTPTITQPSTYQPQKTQKPRKPKRKETQVPQPSGLIDIVADEAVHKELGNSMVRVATTASSLEAEQDNGNITKTRSKATPNEAGSLGTTSGGGLNCQETMGDTISQTRFKNVSKLSNDSLLTRGNTLRSDEDSLKLKELMELWRRINAIDADEDITLVNVQDDTDNETFNMDALTALKSVKPKVKGDVIKEPNVPVNAVSAPTKDKGKGIMIEEPVKPMKKKVQIMLDEEVASRLQAEFDEEERLAREKAEKEKEANIALTEKWDDIQAKIKADHELAPRLQAEEQEKLSDVEKATLFQQLLEKRRKHFAAKRAEEQRNKLPTQAQQRKIMCTYLKNMEGKKLKDLKNKSFDSIQKMFDRAFKRVNTFVDFRTDLVEGSSKRAGEKLEQESTKKQKVDEDKDTAEL